MTAARVRLLAGPLLASAVAVLLLTAPVPAVAAGDPQSGTNSGGSDSSVAAQVNRCLLYANTAGFGAWCGSGLSGRAHTWRQLLGGHPFVACRDDTLPDGALPPPDPPGRPGQWWLETCLVDVDLGAIGGGPHAHPQSRLVFIPTGDPVLNTTPPWMTWLWDSFSSAYPTPVLDVGPTARPRVNVPAYFWLAGASAATITHRVFDGTRYLTMQARLQRLQVHPGVDPAESVVDCGAGTTAYDLARDPFVQTSPCTYTYDRSSAAQPGQAYPARADAYWEVGYLDPAGTRHTLGTFDVGSVQLLPVQEVETVLMGGT